MNIWDYQLDLMRKGLIQDGMKLGSRATDYGVPTSAQPRRVNLMSQDERPYWDNGLFMNHPQSEELKLEKPKRPNNYPDVSGFANSGMQAPGVTSPEYPEVREAQLLRLSAPRLDSSQTSRPSQRGELFNLLSTASRLRPSQNKQANNANLMAYLQRELEKRNG